MSFRANLVPGRASVINFSITSSIGGFWLIKSPYHLDIPDGTICRGPEQEILIDNLVFYDSLMYTESECRNWFHHTTFTAIQACMTTPDRFVLTGDSNFKIEDVNAPKTCTFSAARELSTFHRYHLLARGNQ